MIVIFIILWLLPNSLAWSFILIIWVLGTYLAPSFVVILLPEAPYHSTVPLICCILGLPCYMYYEPVFSHLFLCQESFYFSCLTEILLSLSIQLKYSHLCRINHHLSLLSLYHVHWCIIYTICMFVSLSFLSVKLWPPRGQRLRLIIITLLYLVTFS